MATVESSLIGSFSVSPDMSVSNDTSDESQDADYASDESLNLTPPPQEGKSLHRIREVRMQQGVSLRSAARHTGRDVRTLRAQEEPDSDLKLSDLVRWQQALDVPLIDLLEEGNAPLSRPVMERARLLRLMKTAVAIQERCESAGIRRMADMMIEQLVEVMPELKEVSAWHNYGQRRSLDEMGRIFENQVSDDGWE